MFLFLWHRTEPLYSSRRPPRAFTPKPHNFSEHRWLYAAIIIIILGFVSCGVVCCFRKRKRAGITYIYACIDEHERCSFNYLLNQGSQNLFHSRAKYLRASRVVQNLMHQSKLLYTSLLKCAGNVLIHILKSFHISSYMSKNQQIGRKKHCALHT